MIPPKFPSDMDRGERPSNWNRLRNPTVIGGLIGALVLPASVAQATPTTVKFAEPIIEVGYNSNELWRPQKELPQAVDAAKLAVSAGANTIRTLIPITQRGGTLSGDWEYYCTELQAVNTAGIENVRWGIDFYSPELTFPRGDQVVPPELGGYFPSSLADYKRLRTAEWSLASRFIAGTCTDKDDNPIKLTNVNFEFGEPNYIKRYPYHNMPQKTADALIYTGHMLRKEAIERNATADTGFSLNMNRNNNPIGFLRGVAKRFRDRGLNPADYITEVDLDIYGGGQSSPDEFDHPSQVANPTKVTNVVHTLLGKQIKVGVAEAGYFSDIPKPVSGQYNKPARPTVVTYPGMKQAEQYEALGTYAGCNGLKAFFIFPDKDNPDDGMPSGIFTPWGDAKVSAAPVIKLMQNLQTPNTIVCPQ